MAERAEDPGAGPGRGKYDRGKTREARRAERYERLIRAAGEVFADKGFASTTVADIVARAGVSRQTFYEHFEDTQNALIKVYDHGIKKVFRDAERDLRGIRDPIERLKLGIAGYLANMGRNARLALVFNREIFGAGHEYARLRDASYGRWVALITEGVAEAYAEGVLTRPPDELTAYTLVGGMEQVALRYIDRGEEDRILEAAPVLVALVIRAFGGTPAPDLELPG